MVMPTRHSAAFVGVGHSPVLRYDDVPLGILATQASQAAVADAGLDMSQIDGIAVVPDLPFDTQGAMYDGRDFITANFLVRTLGLQTRWGENQSGMVIKSCIEAVNAVEAGMCDYALVVRGLHSPRGKYGHTDRAGEAGLAQFINPFGAFNASIWARMWTRYQDIYKSGSREQMSTFVLQERTSGLLWEHSYWRQHRPELLTKEEYLSARVAATPMSILDCDIPVQGAGAFVVTTAERARDLPHSPAHVLGIASPLSPSLVNTWTVPLEEEYMSGARVAAQLWADSGLGPGDIDIANVYDGYSIIAMIWLEVLGFCGQGEAFEFIQGGRIARDGPLPLNTSGGNLGAGRMHGVPHLMDAILQVQGRSGPRQITRADTVLAAVGPQTWGSAMIFGRSAW
jgi:acetyl-CoA acetyltransferase